MHPSSSNCLHDWNKEKPSLCMFVCTCIATCVRVCVCVWQHILEFTVFYRSRLFVCENSGLLRCIWKSCRSSVKVLSPIRFSGMNLQIFERTVFTGTWLWTWSTVVVIKFNCKWSGQCSGVFFPRVCRLSSLFLRSCQSSGVLKLCFSHCNILENVT